MVKEQGVNVLKSYAISIKDIMVIDAKNQFNIKLDDKS
jgi:hypothetical protein